MRLHVLVALTIPAHPLVHGNGFLVDQDLVITNRHVLQAIAKWSAGNWLLAPNVAIDFGHEWKGNNSINRRLIKEVVFAGSREINPSSLDHTKLDLAILRLEAASKAVKTLEIDLSDDWNSSGSTICTIGYPGPPPSISFLLTCLTSYSPRYTDNKRLAPGYLVAPVPDSPPDWLAAHDATTLGGNSGSLIIAIGKGGKAAALHYGGKWSEPRQNWSHILADTLYEPD